MCWSVNPKATVLRSWRGDQDELRDEWINVSQGMGWLQNQVHLLPAFLLFCLLPWDNTSGRPSPDVSAVMLDLLYSPKKVTGIVCK